MSGGSTMTVAPETRPQQLDRFLGKDLGDEFVFYDAAGEQVHILNSTARKIYMLCDGSHTMQEIIQTLIADCEIDEATARGDADETIQNLAALGLVLLP